MPNFTKLSGVSLEDTGTIAVTATTNAATIHKMGGIVTSSITNLAASTANSITVTNNKIKSANARILVSVQYSGTGNPVLCQVTPSTGQFVVKVLNVDAVNALNGAYKIAFDILNEG